MKALISRTLPGPVLRAARRLLWNPARELLWQSLRLRCVLRSGLTVEVKSPADWEIYNEILVNGEYDAAISLALDRSCGKVMRILDLGANVGYFVYRCADLFLQRSGRERLSVLAIEGAHCTAQELVKRVRSESLFAGRITVVHGLVGERSGSAWISDTASHYGNSVSSKRFAGTVKASYVDVEAACDPGEDIDLLKCDIEGSEFLFIRNYPDLLARVKVAVFEFHKYGEDIEVYRRLLSSHGLRLHSVLRDAPLFSIEMFTRP